MTTYDHSEYKFEETLETNTNLKDSQDCYHISLRRFAYGARGLSRTQTYFNVMPEFFLNFNTGEGQLFFCGVNTGFDNL